jgi:enamine deaminase RidA (YjgF/YER057c/UK114 family)
VGNYVGLVRVGELIFTSGHGPFRDGAYQFRGKLGQDFDVAAGQQAAELVVLNILATLKQELHELSRITRIVKLLVLVNYAPEFTEQHLVANGASDLLIALFGAAIGPHARSAVGMASLPFGIAVEMEMIVAVNDSA